MLCLALAIQHEQQIQVIDGTDICGAPKPHTRAERPKMNQSLLGSYPKFFRQAKGVFPVIFLKCLEKLAGSV